MEAKQEQKVLEKIYEIAKKLTIDGDVFTRSDLAYQLKSFNVGHDSNEITRLVWTAWEHFGQSKEIESAFTNNAGNQSLVKMYQTAALIDKSDVISALKVIHNELKESNDAIIELENEVARALSDIAVKNGTSIASVIKGTSGVERVKKEADVSFNQYTQMVNAYEAARCNVQETIIAFTELRNDVVKMYREYVMALTDIFGDKVKSIAPDLFDFDKIEWLDVQGMLNQIELQYTSLSSRCSTILGEIESGFQNSLQSSLDTYRALNSKQAGLIMAGISMLGHYLDASSKTAEMSSELMQLKGDMRRDATHIKGDIMRLAKIYKSLNDVIIPQAELFYQYAEKILGGEMSKVLNSLYESQESQALRTEREEMLLNLKDLERQIMDANSNISYFEDNIEECNTILKSLQHSYDLAISTRPMKPNIIVNLITLGHANTNYNRNLYEWNCTSGQLVKRYESLKVDVKLDREDLQTHIDTLNQCKSQYEKDKKRLDVLNKKLLDTVNASPDTKTKMLCHLKDTIKLLQVAKSIAESKLDEKDTHVVNIIDIENLRLPANVEQNIDLFAQMLGEHKTEIENKIQTNLVNQDGTPILDGNLPIDNAINAFQQWAKYAALADEDAKAKEHYETQLEQLKKEFKENLKLIDDKSAFVRDVAMKVKFACSDEEIKQGLFMLAAIDEKEWDNDDWDAFMAGNKELNI